MVGGPHSTHSVRKRPLPSSSSGEVKMGKWWNREKRLQVGPTGHGIFICTLDLNWFFHFPFLGSFLHGSAVLSD